ncbi:TonB-dependent receptor [Alteromonas gilva]|uniref:TonB-dependent receptor n=1 Tax=Alteromonas gilva TaxID=2987522 RepID=A0ABT5L4A7_9ALTE|nr:TonB-dependent receptor [Alteromonas gilva]MDC8831870.1 TonB-dependent receptor [Alteromonas gilva]
MAASALFNASAIAQAVEDAIQPDESAVQLEVIEVTAQKRVQSKMDVPLAVSVLGASDLERLDVNNFNDVTRVSPSLTMSQGDTPAGSVIRMRGIGTAAFSIGAEPSVSVVVDEVPLIRTAQAFGNLVDIQRIEVLRGPQGTLFGKNASAGVVSITTKNPAYEFEGDVQVGITDDDEKKAQISLSDAINDDAGYRINAYVKDRDGFIENIADGSDLNGEEGYGFRGKLVWNMTPDLQATFIGDTSHNESSTGITWSEGDEAVTGEGITASEDNRKVKYDSPVGFTADQDMFVLKLDYMMPNHTLTSVTSYQKYDLLGVVDVDQSDTPIEDNPFLNPLGLTGPRVESISGESSDAVSQEIRLSADNVDGFEYMVGLFYMDASTDRSYDRGALRFLLADWDATASTESFALFGQATYEFTNKTAIDIGLRANREKISASFTNRYANGWQNIMPETYSGDDSENAVTGKVALRHNLSDEQMVFGSVSTGYKGQAYDISTGFNQTKADNPVNSETSVSYELGIKGFALDRKLSYEVIGFFSDFDDYQAQAGLLDENDAPVFRLTNVGQLRTKGIETDLSYQATRDLRFNASIAYIDATIVSFKNADCYDFQTAEQGCNIGQGPGGIDVQDLSGEDLNNSPDLKYNLGVAYETDVSSQNFSFFAQANYQWQDDINYDLLGNPVNFQEAYGIANMSLGIIGAEDKYKLTFYVNNLFDQNYSMGYSDYSARFEGATAVGKQWNRNAMRYMGINFSYSF